MNKFNINIITLFPEMFPGTLGLSIAGKAESKNIWKLNVINLRDFGIGERKNVDDSPYGGGAGMVIRPNIIASAIESIKPENRGEIIYFSPRGKLLNQSLARKYSKQTNLTLICGRYEGIDQRVIDAYNMTEISIGDYILSGGDLAAQVFIDTCVRLLDNVVNKTESINEESFEIGLLEYPLYTRPEVWNGIKVPEILLSGHHENISKWRLEQAQRITSERRPDLLNDNKKQKETK